MGNRQSFRIWWYELDAHATVYIRANRLARPFKGYNSTRLTSLPAEALIRIPLVLRQSHAQKCVLRTRLSTFEGFGIVYILPINISILLYSPRNYDTIVDVYPATLGERKQTHTDIFSQEFRPEER